MAIIRLSLAAARQRTVARRCLSTSETTQPQPTAPPCDIVQGPSLLRTPASRPSPSLFWLPGLRSLPFWTSGDRVAYNDATVKRVVQHLESNAGAIRDEYQKVAVHLPSDYEGTDHGGGGAAKNSSDDSNDDSRLHSGDWKWHSYMSKGSIKGQFCHEFPDTAKVLQELRNDHLLFEGTPFGFAFFSSLAPGASIKPHTSPMNLRLRVHLPLIVPKTSNNNNENMECGIQVGTTSRRWVENQALVLDDSYQHQVWNDSPDETRVLLLVDIWHPDIGIEEKKAIVGMFQEAKEKGMWTK